MASPRAKDWELFATIGKEELLDALRAGNTQIVNVLPSPGTEVIPTTRHIPLDELEDRLGELDRTWPVPYEGGTQDWTRAGLPTERSGSAAEQASVEADG
jgi:hypothetical protein